MDDKEMKEELEKREKAYDEVQDMCGLIAWYNTFKRPPTKEEFEANWGKEAVDKTYSPKVGGKRYAVKVRGEKRILRCSTENDGDRDIEDILDGCRFGKDIAYFWVKCTTEDGRRVIVNLDDVIWFAELKEGEE